LAVNLITLSARNPMRVVLLSVLIFEVIVFGLAVPVMIFNSNVALGIAIGFAGSAMVLALVAAGMLRRPAGYALGWLTQVVALALGALTPAMFVVGALFAGLWVFTFVLGKRLDAAKETSGP
jgi:Protein of unknown function (DUF4233)